MDDVKEIKLIDLADRIKYNKNIYKKNLIRVILAIPKAFKTMLLNKEEIVFDNFLKLGFRTAKDRMVKAWSGEQLHMPAHIKFKAVFFDDVKKYLNEEKK